MDKKEQILPLSQTAVSGSYYDKDGNLLEFGDILFYSEFDGENKDWHYADGIYLIIEKEYELAAKCKVMTQTNATSFIDYDEPTHNVLKLSQYFKNGICREFLKIGNVKNNSEMLSAEYANKTYSVL